MPRSAVPAAVGTPEERLAAYPRRYCPLCGHLVQREFKPGPGGRLDASCPRCGSLERHRFLAVLLSVLRPMLDDVGVLLDVAPSRQVTPMLERLEPRVHVRLDLGFDNRLVDVLGSLTALPHPDSSVDLLVCYHVLEHVPDDTTAMREIARVLAPGGFGLLQVPFRPGTRTDEDPAADEAERLRRFGQADHVRYYGDDFEDRLVAAGLSIQRFTPRSLLGEEMCTWLKLVPDEVVWLVRKGDGAAVPPPLVAAPSMLTGTLSALVGELTEVRGKLVTQRRRARELEEEMTRLREDNDRLRAGLPGLARRVGSRVRRRLGR